ATVTITVSGDGSGNNLIWFVDENAASNGDGRLTSPFSTLNNFHSVNDGAATHPKDGDYVFLYESATSYVGPVTLRTGQTLFGQDATTTIAALAGITVPAGSSALPSSNTGGGTVTLVASGGANAITLGSGNTLRGFTIGSVGTAGTGIFGNGYGSLTLASAGSADVKINTDGRALALTNGTGAGTFHTVTSTGGTNNVLLNSLSGSLDLGTGALSGASGDAFTMTTGAGTVSYAGSIALVSANKIVTIQSKTGGAVTLSGALSCFGSCAGITVANNSGGSTTFSGAAKLLSTGTNPGVSLTTNTGATTNFTGGGLGITTSSGTGFNATGGGTVTVTTGANPNTITSTTGTALNVANTTIGAAGLTFQSISANGGTNGIVLNGTSGNLTVTGDGTGHANGSGGSISNITGGVIGNAPVYMLTASGTVTLSSMNMSLNTNAYSGMLVDNNAGGTVTVNITGSTFTGVTNSVVQNKALLQFEAGNNASIAANVQNSFFNGSRTYGMFATGAGTSTVNVTLNQSGFGTNVNTGAAVNRPGSSITNPPAFSLGITNGSDALVDYTVSNNTFWGADAAVGAIYAVTISGAGTNAGSHLNGSFTNNKIGETGVASSGCLGNCAGLGLLPGTGGTFNANVSGNDIRQVGAQGINFFNSVTAANGTSISHITNNTIAEPVTGFTIFLRAIVVSSGNSGGSSANWCADVTNNNISGLWQAASFVRITTLNTTGILTIPGLSPASGATGAQVDSHIEGLNTVGAGNSNTTVGGAINGGAPCP
ncbi:MAG: beta strand repeat-containing protein, partial [Chloroflexota bacterium]